MLPVAPAGRQLDLGALQFVAPEEAAGELVAGRPHSVLEMLRATDTDCFVVLHKGVIIHESYMNGVDERTQRLGMSMGKTLTAALVGIMIDRGLVQPSALLTDYVPELAGTGYEGATVQNALDMCVGVDFDGEPWPWHMHMHARVNNTTSHEHLMVNAPCNWAACVLESTTRPAMKI